MGSDIIMTARVVDPGLFFPTGPLDTDEDGTLTWDNRYGDAPADLLDWLCGVAA